MSTMSERKIRYPYLDVAKGILILSVVLHHMSLQLDTLLPNDIFTRFLHVFSYNSWVLFFMPAFFIITGRCTNFKKKFKDYLIDNIISLKVPVFFFIGILGALSIRPLFGFSPFNPHWWFVRMFDSGVWFLHALFLSKILFWGIDKLSSVTLQLVFCLILFFGGIWCFTKNILTFCWLSHTASLTIFLFIGNVLKKKEIKGYFGIVCATLFIISVIIINALGNTPPLITQEPQVSSLRDSILILLLALTGSIAFLSLCKYIDKNKALQYVGKYSLVIYIIHGPELIEYMIQSVPFFNTASSFCVLVDFSLRYIFVVSSILGIAYILDRPYLRIIIGKKI